MNTQRIRILLTAIDKGSLTKAGQTLGYTQSYLTQTVKAFEDEIGFPLLVKTNRGVEPTNEAQMLIPAMRELIRSEERLDQEMAEIQGLHRGTIRIGTFVSTSVYWVPQIIEYFHNNYPEVVFQIEELGHEEMIRGLIDGSLDITLMSDPGKKVNIDFIPVLEESGLVYDLDCFVWDRVCQDLQKWNGLGIHRSVSVNLSRCDMLEDRDIPEHFNSLTRKYGLSPDQLRIEITETAYVENPDLLICTTKELREFGFQVEMDDFGSGYSSLHMLKEVPVDRIKLDLYFLTETGDQKRGSNIIKHMIQMARSLEMDIIAEGVEKTEQAEFLIENGCYEMQGFYFYKPMPVQEFEKLNENYKVKNEMNCT